jgi:hypothetical protein
MTLHTDDTAQFETDLIRELRELEKKTETIQAMKVKKCPQQTKRQRWDFESWSSKA